MPKPTTFRIPEDLLQEIEKQVRDLKVDRSTYLREVLQKGFLEDKQDRILKKYTSGEISMSEVCQELNWTPWDFFNQMKAKNLYLNVSLEDWLDSESLDSTA